MKKLIGPMIFLAVAAVFGYLQLFGSPALFRKVPPPEPISVSAIVGGEKSKLLEDDGVARILTEKYGLRLDWTKAGSIEMVRDLPTEGRDALWPSNQIAAAIFTSRGRVVLSQETIFNSPVVIYAYDIVADALAREGIVEKQAGHYYIVDFQKLIRMILDGNPWGAIGLPELYGKISIFSTDPTRSNSGNMFAGLLANVLNGGAVVTEDTLPACLPQLKQYFRQRGYMERSNSDIFKNFIVTGVGAKPMIVGYENQLIEFAIENEKYADYLKQRIRTLYPVPTVWSSHPIIALTPGGKRLIEALEDGDIQKTAWERHGFRSGLMGVENDPDRLAISGIPKEIRAVIPLPSAGVMAQIIAALEADAP